ncbi:MAG: hypothetical protein ACK5T6_07015, partial [Pirellula sp.]
GIVKLQTAPWEDPQPTSWGHPNEITYKTRDFTRSDAGLGSCLSQRAESLRKTAQWQYVFIRLQKILV